MSKNAILGISAYYHDSAAVVLVDGKIIAAAQEERFTRKKHDSDFPFHAIRYVLEEAGLEAQGYSSVAFYEKPFIKFERLLETYHSFAPFGLSSFLSAMPVWIREKLFMKQKIRKQLEHFGLSRVPLLFPEHHLSHAASAFYPSPFTEAAIVTIDGVGEWATTTIGRGCGRNITMLRELEFPHSIGLLYSAFTYYCGFRVNSGEYKLMGLAPYGDPHSPETTAIKEKITTELVDIRSDGSVLMNMDFFEYATGLRMVNEKKWAKLFGIPKRAAEDVIDKRYMNMALAVQGVTEDVVERLAITARSLTKCENLVMAGGVALNCVANGKLVRKKIFENIWVQPAAGDAGGALGAALCAWYIGLCKERAIDNFGSDSMHGSYLGPEFSDRDVEKLIRKHGAAAKRFSDFQNLCSTVADILDSGNVVGWFQGRMEYGPRALGNRSIIADPRNREMQKKLNLKIKFREGFRPFAPSVLYEDMQDYFDFSHPTPYMLMVAPVQCERCCPIPENYHTMELYERLYFQRSDLPAITHVDFSARIQSVHRDTNEKYWQLIKAFKERTGIGVIVNTSFNVRGEPIVCTPEEAYRCFMTTNMDYLVVNSYLFRKEEQSKDTVWKSAVGVD
ncbi:MAG TPA: carbamoyltransferase [Chitinispirillaceae bacterium]|nr:carbamoyltransferase [Chitinispirillaceae bacterium]